MNIEPPKKPLPWEENPELKEIDRNIRGLEIHTNRSFFGMDNWRDKEAGISELEWFRTHRNTVVQNAKKQYQAELEKYNELYKAYEVELEIERKRMEEEAKENEKRLKKISHTILGMDLK